MRSAKLGAARALLLLMIYACKHWPAGLQAGRSSLPSHLTFNRVVAAEHVGVTGTNWDRELSRLLMRQGQRTGLMALEGMSQLRACWTGNNVLEPVTIEFAELKPEQPA